MMEEIGDRSVVGQFNLMLVSLILRVSNVTKRTCSKLDYWTSMFGYRISKIDRMGLENKYPL